MGGKNLAGDGAVEACVTRLINLAHSARTERRENLIRPSFVPEVKAMNSADYNVCRDIA
jgi:hypothetical protein